MCVHMAHGLNSVLKRGPTIGLNHTNNNNNNNNYNNNGKNENNNTNGKSGGIGSRRIFAPHFKLQVLDSYRNDADCKGNQRATARKYGIHRRQIQKWLQVENNLRNSVCQNNNNNNTKNYNDNNNNSIVDKGVQEQRVPALIAPPPPPPPAPLDYTTNHRSSPRVASPGASVIITQTPSPPIPADPAIPIDLSLKRPPNTAPVVMMVTSAAVTPPPHLIHRQQRQQEQPMSPPSLPQPHPDVWDLSINNNNNTNNKRKFDDENEQQQSPTITTKTVKLFKPYLDDVFENSDIIVESTTYQQPPPCCNNSSFTTTTTTCESYYYQQHQQHNEINNTYILHELQPKSTINYYYQHQLPPTNCCQINNTTDYEMITTTTTYEEQQSSNYILPLKQRHNYSLDFKLSAIECYYQDSLCKGNQRAVATKYNIHRRQIQKWLKQADELKQRNESIKHTQTVR